MKTEGKQNREDAKETAELKVEVFSKKGRNLFAFTSHHQCN